MRKERNGSVSASLLALLIAVTGGMLFGEGSLQLDPGEHIYKTACAACHGPDGKGTPKSIAGFEPPDSFPDFTRCDQTTAELDNDYRAVIIHGGQYRGFSQIMPSFKQALTPEQINKVIGYLRHFCREDNPNSWPRGELNLPRAMVTEKAYPEDEVVVSTAVNARGAPGSETHIIHEQRFGKKNQLEVDETSTGGFRPTPAEHIADSALCATCHTLYTKSLSPGGKVLGEFPEQMPYQEWLHSDYPNKNSCQSCHMPAVQGQAPISAVMDQLRAGVRQHTFLGGNFFVLRLLNAYRDDLDVTAMPVELTAEAKRTIDFLQTQAARVIIRKVDLTSGKLNAEIFVENLTGHKLPTAFPSRRAWLHVLIRDHNGQTVFESGALNPDGSIKGNVNDVDASRFMPHYREITTSDQVEIYEPILKDQAGHVTTGLAAAVGYLKDNRLLPAGFEKQSAHKDIAVVGDAADDPNFTDTGDSVRYSVSLGDAQGPFRIEAELWYQPIGFRWAHNLAAYDAPETKRIVGYYDSMPSGTAIILAHAQTSF